MFRLSNSNCAGICLVGAFALLVGCGSQPDSNLAESSAAILDGDWTDGPPPQLDDEPVASTSGEQTAEAPCGDDTVAQVTAPNGNVITFCVLEDGTTVVSETGEIGNTEYTTSAGAQSLSVAELYSRVAGPDAPIPDKLLEVGDVSTIPLQTEKKPTGDVAAAQQAILTYKPAYCSNAATFANEQCSTDYDANFCGNAGFTGSIRTCSAYFRGITPCLKGVYTIAACGTGNTKQELLRRDTTNRSWGSVYSIYIPSQYFNAATVRRTDLAGDDFRLVGTAQSSGGWFRYFAGFISD